jgi:hypothetical protein
MPNIYLSNEQYDRIIRLGKQVTEFVKNAVEKALNEDEKK